MFYPSYDDYMRDIFYYNGLAGNNTGVQNGLGFQGNMNGFGCSGMNNYMAPMQNSNQNFNNLYPSIYRIVYPVVQKVISEGNFQVINDETISNITDTIYNIVEGDLNSAQSLAQNSNSNQQNGRTNQTPNQNINNSSNSSNSQGVTNYATANSNNQNNSNSLLKDLIRILVIRELISRRNIRRFPYNTPYYNTNQFMPSYMF